MQDLTKDLPSLINKQQFRQYWCKAFTLPKIFCDDKKVQPIKSNNDFIPPMPVTPNTNKYALNINNQKSIPGVPSKQKDLSVNIPNIQSKQQETKVITDQKKVSKNNDFTKGAIVLLEKKNYFSGEQINGSIYVNMFYNKDIESIDIEIEGNALSKLNKMCLLFQKYE